MATALVPRDRIADGSLPSVCVVCGAHAPYLLFPKVGMPSLAWIFVSPLIGLIGFWVSILFTGRHSGMSGLPFCGRHRGYWPRRAWFIVIGFAVLVVLMVAMVALVAPGEPGRREEPPWLAGPAACWLLLYLPAFLLVHLTATRPTGGDDRLLKLSGVSEQFAVAVEESGRA